MIFMQVAVKDLYVVISIASPVSKEDFTTFLLMENVRRRQK